MRRKPAFYKSPFDTLVISVQYVFRANFNDTYFIDSREISIDELSRDEIYWFDPFLGKSKLGKARVALVGCGKEHFRMQSTDGENISERRLDSYLDFIVSEDYDESRMLAAHIRVARRR